VVTATEVTVRDAARPANGAAAAEWLGSAVFWWLCALLIFGPLAFGAVERWSMFILHAGSVVLFGLWAAQQVISGELRIARSPLYGPLVAFAVLVAIQLAGTTRYRSVTVDEALNYVSYGIIFFVATQSLSHRRQLVRFATVLATFGFLLAAFALIQELTSNGKLYWLRAPRVSTAMFGPYVNHSNYAGMMELLAMVPLVLAVRGAGRLRRRADGHDDLYVWLPRGNDRVLRAVVVRGSCCDAAAAAAHRTLRPHRGDPGRGGGSFVGRDG
jgi:hypothetical protein